MYCTSNIPQSQNQSSFITGESSYLQYPPTSISQNILANTSYSSSTSTLGSGGQTIFSWAHTVPTYMPWAPKHDQGTNEGLPSVVRFMAPATTGPIDPCTSQTATTWELIHNLGNTCSGVHTVNQHLKRRSDIDSDEDSDDVSEESENEDSSNTNLQGSIILSPELKEIIQPNPDLVKALLQEQAKPSMALVLWQPPGGAVREKIDSHISSSSAKHCAPDNNSNNNVTNNMNVVSSFMPVTSRISESDLLNSSKGFRLQFQPGVPCSSISQCLDETDDMEL